VIIAVALLVEGQERHPVCKNYLSPSVLLQNRWRKRTEEDPAEPGSPGKPWRNRLSQVHLENLGGTD